MVVNVYDAPSLLQNINSAIEQRNIAIDDMGTESMLVDYGTKRDVVSEIFDAAEKTGKLLIVSTNLRKDPLIDRYGERIFERVISTTKRIEFTGKSLRK
jgi:DNA replication protein DnaC